MEMKCRYPVRDLTRLLQVRYHHDGKYNVMSLDGPIEIHGKSRVASNSLLSRFLD